MLINDIRLDQGGPEALLAIRDEWRATGASEPSLLDIVAKLPSFGTRVLRPVSAAVVKSNAAHGIAVDYLKAVESQFSRRVIDLTLGLTTDRRDVSEILAELERADADAGALTASVFFAQQDGPTPAFDAGAGEIARQAGDAAEDGHDLSPEAAKQRRTSIESLQKGLMVQINQPEAALRVVRGDLVYGGIGVRQNLVDRIKAGGAGRGDVVREIANGEPQRLLAGLYGAERAAVYCMALNNELSRWENAHDVVFYRWFLWRSGKSDRACQAIVKLATSPLDVEWLKDPAWQSRFLWPWEFRGVINAVSRGLSSLRSRLRT